MVKLDMQAGLFYEIEKGLFLLPWYPLKRGTHLTLEPNTDSSMFTMNTARGKDGEVRGMLFQSGYKIVNGGSYLLTYLKANRDLQPQAQEVIRTPHLVLYNYAGQGSLALSPKLSSAMRTIVEEQ